MQTTFIAVRCEWLAVPLALPYLSLGFLVATMMKTDEGANGAGNVKKTSAMPTLVYGLSKKVQQNLRKSSRANNSNARKLKIRLLLEPGCRVSGHVIASLTLSWRPKYQPPPSWI